MIVSADTNLFLYAANPDSSYHEAARRFFEVEATGGRRFLLCGLVLVEIYIQFRNPAVFKKPKSGPEATAYPSIIHQNSSRSHAQNDLLDAMDFVRMSGSQWNQISLADALLSVKESV